ncbi:hypothetical protein BD779DRAFT_1513122 [Infundibulicybe gibba]|nr:hypothetical protein BD779DRAFT_1513122 [Infundibulicybe gibba]
MDRNVLEQLSRPQIQALAKHEGIKANITTELMIARLLLKHPEGVPNLVTFDATQREPGRGGNATPTKSVTGKKRPRPLDLENKSHRKPKYSRFVTPPFNEGTPEASAADEAPPPGPQPPLIPNPSEKTIRRVRRGITKLLNAGAAFPKSFEVDEKAFMRIHDRIKADLTMVSVDVSDLVSIHVSVQENLMKSMKSDRTLWDGTSDLPADKQALWRQLIEKIKKEEEEELERIREERLRAAEDQESISSDSSESLDLGEFGRIPRRQKN